MERYLYSPYGVVTIYDATWTNTRSESTCANVTLYTSRELDAQTGLYYYRNRDYNAELGRFVSGDPIGYFNRPNLYEYVGNTPLRLIDPLGLVKCNADNEGARRGVAGDTVFSPGDLRPDFAKMTINLMAQVEK